MGKISAEPMLILLLEKLADLGELSCQDLKDLCLRERIPFDDYFDPNKDKNNQADWDDYLYHREHCYDITLIELTTRWLWQSWGQNSGQQILPVSPTKEQMAILWEISKRGSFNCERHSTSEVMNIKWRIHPDWIGSLSKIPRLREIDF